MILLPLHTHSPEHPIQIKIGTYTLLCTLKKEKSQNHQNSLHWVRKWVWKGHLYLQSASRAKFMKNVFLAVAHQGLTWDQKFWHTPVVTQWDRTFLFSKLFSSVNYMVTVGHLGFPKNRIFQLWGPLAGAPYVTGPQKWYQNLRMAFIWKVSH